jgi:hypothetical protein
MTEPVPAGPFPVVRLIGPLHVDFLLVAQSLRRFRAVDPAGAKGWHTIALQVDAGRGARNAQKPAA